MKRPLAYITAAWSGNECENTETAARYCRQVYEAGYSPICPILLTGRFIHDGIPQEHKDSLDMARDYLRRSRVLVVAAHHRHHPGRHPDREGPGPGEVGICPERQPRTRKSCLNGWTSA